MNGPKFAVPAGSLLVVIEPIEILLWANVSQSVPEKSSMPRSASGALSILPEMVTPRGSDDADVMTAEISRADACGAALKLEANKIAETDKSEIERAI